MARGKKPLKGEEARTAPGKSPGRGAGKKAAVPVVTCMNSGRGAGSMHAGARSAAGIGRGAGGAAVPGVLHSPSSSNSPSSLNSPTRLGKRTSANSQSTDLVEVPLSEVPSGAKQRKTMRVWMPVVERKHSAAKDWMDFRTLFQLSDDGIITLLYKDYTLESIKKLIHTFSNPESVAHYAPG